MTNQLQLSITNAAMVTQGFHVNMGDAAFILQIPRAGVEECLLHDGVYFFGCFFHGQVIQSH